MAVARAVTYSGPSGSVIRGGRFATTAVSGTVTLDGASVAGGFIVAGSTALSGSVALDSVGVAGGFTSQVAPVLSGGITLDDALAAGGGLLQWTFVDGATLNTGRSTTTALATGVPAGATFYASPDLLPGQSLQLSGTALNLVGDSAVPTVNGDSAGSAIDTISDRDVVIEVMDSPLASMRLIRAGSLIGTYGKGQSTPTTWWHLMLAAQDGDVVEISPGAINAIESDCSNYYSNSLDSCAMAIVRGVTIKEMDGRGRWRLFPVGATFANNRNGIGIFAVGDGSEISGKLSISISGFDAVDQFSTNACGVRIRNKELGGFSGYHTQVTLKNFKIGRTTGQSLSGVSGAAEGLTLENGHVFDCGNGSGQEHNLYIGAKTMLLRGIRSNRTRGWIATPYTSSATSLEGHIAKLDAVNGTVEGCCLDGNDGGDYSLLMQMKAGGNWTIRGNLFRDSPWTNVHNGAISMCREMNADGVTPNYKSWAGSEGNSLLFEKNVFASHMARPLVWFFAQANVNALRPATGGSYTDAERMQSLVVRDNIAMAPSSMRSGYGSAYVLSGWSSQNTTTKPMWINNDPNAGDPWGTRGNVVLTYDQAEAAFAYRDLLLYTQAGGPTAADAGSVSTYRFLPPHGFMARTDAYKGLA